MEQPEGLEPSSADWQPAALPLCYGCETIGGLAQIWYSPQMEIQAICAYTLCAKPFVTTTTSQKRRRQTEGRFCSQRCSSLAWHRTLPPPTPNLTCAQCDTPFYRSVGRHKHSKSGIRFCSRVCKDIAQRVGGNLDIHPPHYKDGSTAYRARGMHAHGARCARCGYDEFAAVLEVHHRDEDRKNGSTDNLVVLCANCHTAVHRCGVTI